MPRFNERPRPIDPFDMDRTTLRELIRVLEDRLRAVEAFGSCPCCHEAEARAFLASMMRLLNETGG